MSDTSATHSVKMESDRLCDAYDMLYLSAKQKSPGFANFSYLEEDDDCFLASPSSTPGCNKERSYLYSNTSRDSGYGNNSISSNDDIIEINNNEISLYHKAKSRRKSLVDILAEADSSDEEESASNSYTILQNPRPRSKSQPPVFRSSLGHELDTIEENVPSDLYIDENGVSKTSRLSSPE